LKNQGAKQTKEKVKELANKINDGVRILKTLAGLSDNNPLETILVFKHRSVTAYIIEATKIIMFMLPKIDANFI
jgi:hypothetical protein